MDYPRGARVHGAGEVCSRQRRVAEAARPGSLEDALHAATPGPAMLVFPRHRAIGVVYHPQRERQGNYVSTVLGDRYDAFCWYDQTRAVTPLPTRTVEVLEPETYPSGV